MPGCTFSCLFLKPCDLKAFSCMMSCYWWGTRMLLLLSDLSTSRAVSLPERARGAARSSPVLFYSSFLTLKMFINRSSVLFELIIRRLDESKKSFLSFYSPSSSSEEVSSKSVDSRTIILLILSTKTLWSAVSVPMAVKTKSRTRWIIFSRSSSLSSRV